MPVLTVASRKGGTGKTTITLAITAALAREGLDVALLDTDPNGGAHRWTSQRYAGPPVTVYSEADTERLADLLPTLAGRHAVLLVDTAGFGNRSATVAMGGADAVLIPVTPGEYDLVEAGKTVAFVDGLARTSRRPIPARVIANRLRRSTTLTKHILAELEAAGLPRFATTLSESVTYGELGFSDSGPTQGAAAEEIAALIAEIRDLGWLPQPRSVILRKAVK